MTYDIFIINNLNIRGVRSYTFWCLMSVGAKLVRDMACNGTEWWWVWVVAFVASTWPLHNSLRFTLLCVDEHNLLVGGKKWKFSDPLHKSDNSQFADFSICMIYTFAAWVSFKFQCICYEVSSLVLCVHIVHLKFCDHECHLFMWMNEVWMSFTQ